ncbi:MAG TPA: ethanolamine utilization protein [Mobilitalea sp.]|nr:ethanolamine utilization protein [Mobilitalea sp.]
MKYITEEDLRDLYRKEPFTNYNLEPGVRLTPGARQFLLDKGISGFDTDTFSKGKSEDTSPPAVMTEKKEACSNKKLLRYMRSIEALFLQTEQELLVRDVCLAQSVVNLGKQFHCIMNAVNGKGAVENLICSECTGINNNNFSEDLDVCFEVTEFHIQLEKGREIVILHRLRCALYELVSMIQELLEGRANENGSLIDLDGKIYQIINSISQLICTAFGGKKCQRQG